MPKLTLSMAVRTGGLRPEEVTKVLEMQPDHVVIRGPDRIPPRMRPPDHGWFIDRVDEESGDLVRVFGELIDRVRPLVPRVAALREVDPTTEIIFHVAIRPLTDRVPLFFGKDVVETMAAFGADLDIEFFGGWEGE